MNEDLLRELYNKYNLSSVGTVDEFISDMNSPDVAEAFYNKYLAKQKIGTVDEFFGDLGLEYTPIVARPPKQNIAPNASGAGVELGDRVKRQANKTIDAGREVTPTKPIVVKRSNVGFAKNINWEDGEIIDREDILVDAPRVPVVKKQLNDMYSSIQEEGVLADTELPTPRKGTTSNFSWQSIEPVTTILEAGSYKTSLDRGSVERTDEDIERIKQKSVNVANKEEELKDLVASSLVNQDLATYIEQDVYEDFDGTVEGKGGDFRAKFDTYINGVDYVAEDIGYIVDYNLNKLNKKYGNLFLEYIKDSETINENSHDEDKSRFFQKYQEILEDPLTEEISVMQGKFNELNPFKSQLEAQLFSDPDVKKLYEDKEFAKENREGVLRGTGMPQLEWVDGILDVAGRNLARLVGRTEVMIGGLLPGETGGKLRRRGKDLKELNPKSTVYEGFLEEHIVDLSGLKLIYETADSKEPSYVRNEEGQIVDVSEAMLKSLNKEAEGKERVKKSNKSVYLSMFADTVMDLVPQVLLTRGIGSVPAAGTQASKLAYMFGASTAGFTQVRGQALEELSNVVELTQDQKEGIATMVGLGTAVITNINPLESKIATGTATNVIREYIKKNAADIASGKKTYRDVLGHLIVNSAISGVKEFAEEGSEQYWERNFINPVANELYGSSLQEGTTEEEMESIAKISLGLGSIMDVAGNINYTFKDTQQVLALEEVISNREMYNAYINGVRSSQPAIADNIDSAFRPILDEIDTFGKDLDTKTKTKIAGLMLWASRLEKDIAKIKNPNLKKAKENELAALYEEITKYELGEKKAEDIKEEVNPTKTETTDNGAEVEIKPVKTDEVDLEEVGAIDEVVDSEGNVITPESRQTGGKKEFIGKDVTGKKVYSDFDNTLYDPTTGELTEIGKELRQKLDSGELTPEDVEIITAREEGDLDVIKGLFPELTVTGNLTPEGKAAKVAEAGGNSLFIDDNEDNLAAVTTGEEVKPEVTSKKKVTPKADKVEVKEEKPKEIALEEVKEEGTSKEPKTYESAKKPTLVKKKVDAVVEKEVVEEPLTREELEARKETELASAEARTVRNRKPTSSDGEFFIEDDIYKVDESGKLLKRDEKGKFFSTPNEKALIAKAEKDGFVKTKQSVTNEYDAKIAALESKVEDTNEGVNEGATKQEVESSVKPLKVGQLKGLSKAQMENVIDSLPFEKKENDFRYGLAPDDTPTKFFNKLKRSVGIDEASRLILNELDSTKPTTDKAPVKKEGKKVSKSKEAAASEKGYVYERTLSSGETLTESYTVKNGQWYDSDMNVTLPADSPKTKALDDKYPGVREGKTGTTSEAEVDTAINLKNAAKDFVKAFTVGDGNIGIIFDPKAAALSRVKATKDLFNAIVDYIKDRVSKTKGKYNIDLFKADLEKGKVGNIQISDDGLEYLFDEATAPEKNREQVKIVEELRKEVEDLYKRIDDEAEDLDYFADKVKDIFKRLGEAERKSNKRSLFTTSEVKNLIDKAGKIRSEEDLKSFENDLESALEDKETKRFKAKVDKEHRAAKKKVKALKTRDAGNLRNAVLFNPRDRKFQAEDAKANNQELKRFYKFLEAINKPEIPKGKAFLDEAAYFSKKRNEQSSAYLDKQAIKKAEFNERGDLLQDGKVVTLYQDLPKQFRDEFERRQMNFNNDGDLVDKNGRIIKNSDNLSKKEKEELARRAFKSKKEANKIKKEKSDAETKEDLLDEFRGIKAMGRSSQADQALQKVADSFHSLTEEDVNSLPTKELEQLIAGYKTLDSISILPDGFEQLISDSKKKAVTDNTIAALEGSKGAFRSLMRDIVSFGKLGKLKPQDLMKRFIEKTPLRRIDAIFKGKDGTYFYDTFVNPLAVGFGQFTAFNNRLKKDLRALSSGVKTRDAFKLMLYSIDKQYKNNPGSEELSSVEEEIKNALAFDDSNYQEGDFKILKEVYDELMAEMGGEFDYTKMDAATSGPLAIKPNERELLNFTENLGNSQAGKVMVTAARTGRDTKIYNNYTPLERISPKTLGKQMEEFTDETIDANNYSIDSVTIPGNVNTRVKNTAPIRNWNFVTANYNSAKKTELDYQLRQNLKDFGNNTKAIIDDLSVKIDAAKKSGNTAEVARLKAYKDFMSATRDAIKDVARDNLVSQFDEYSDAEAFARALTDIGYGAILASFPRAGVELLSNVYFAVMGFPLEFLSGIQYMMSSPNLKKTNGNIDKLIGLVPTTQSSRLLQQSGSLYRDQTTKDVRGLGATKAANAIIRTAEKVASGINFINDSLNSFGDKAVAKPMWYGSFENEVNKLLKESGRTDKFDIEKYNSDENYRFELNNIVDKATKVADANLSQGFSSFNPFESIADLKLDRKSGYWDTFKRFLQRFIRFEYQSAEDAVSALVGRGSMSRTKGLQLLIATVGRMSMYTLLVQKLSDLFDDEVMRPAINAVVENTLDIPNIISEPEEEEDDIESKVGTAVLGSVLSMVFGRRMNALMKVPVNLSIEAINAAYGKELGLRDTEGYSAYKNSLVFSNIKLPNIDGFSDAEEDILFSLFGHDFKKPIIKPRNLDAYALKTIAGFAGPYNPAISNSIDLFKDAFRSKDKELNYLEDINPYKEYAKRELLWKYSTAATITSYLPTLAPRDLKRNIQQTKAAIEYGPAVNSPVYTNALKPGASKETIKSALEYVNDLRKTQAEELEARVDKFLDSDEWKDIIESTKKDGATKRKFTVPILNSKGKYNKPREYTSRNGNWFYMNESTGKESQVRGEEMIDQLNGYKKFADYRDTWAVFMTELHKMSFGYHIEPKEIGPGEFEFVPRGNGTKLEQALGKVEDLKVKTRKSIKKYFE